MRYGTDVQNHKLITSQPLLIFGRGCFYERNTMKTRIRQAVLLLLIVALIAGMVPAVYAATNENETISGVKLFDLASPNYTTYLSTAVSVTYRPNGTGNTLTANIKNLGWHFARINNVPYEDNPLYCIEPHKNYAASTSGNYVDNNVGTDGAGFSQGTNVWYALPPEYREAIALILLFSNEMWDTTSAYMMSLWPTTPMFRCESLRSS